MFSCWEGANTNIVLLIIGCEPENSTVFLLTRVVSHRSVGLGSEKDGSEHRLGVHATLFRFGPTSELCVLGQATDFPVVVLSSLSTPHEIRMMLEFRKAVRGLRKCFLHSEYSLIVLLSITQYGAA